MAWIKENSSLFSSIWTD